MPSMVDKLFKNKYWMNVEERAFYSDEEIEHIGVMGVTTMEEAEIILGRFRQVRVTIPMIAHYYSLNLKLQFIDVKKAPEMFEIIDGHLDNWKQITNRLGYVSPMPPIEDFELLDKLAEVLYPYRKASSALVGVFSLFQSSLSVAGNLEYTDGIYKPYSPGLYKYCCQVWEEESGHASP